MQRGQRVLPGHRQPVNIVTNLVRFGVPMIYSYELVDERFGRFADYYVYNPVADAVMLFQQAFWAGTTKDPQDTWTTSCRRTC